jgi:hypothetical protein
MSNTFADNPFVTGLFDWMSSPEGELAEQVRDVTWEMLEDATPDIVNRQLIWEDGEALTIRGSAQRIEETIEPGQGVTVELIEAEILSWLEMGYSPDELSVSEQDELEKHITAWIKAHRKEMKKRRR